jgi:hypothetical protein
MTDTSLRSFLVFGSAVVKHFTRPDVINKLWSSKYYYKCVSLTWLSGTHIASFLRRIIQPSVACLAVQRFSTSCYTRHDFPKKWIEHKICVLSSSTTSVCKICHRVKNSARYHKCT